MGEHSNAGSDASNAGSDVSEPESAEQEQPGRSITALWVEGARLRTLPLAVAPVVLGLGAAAYQQSADIFRAALCLVLALCLQIGVNYANDYSDGIWGTDDVRVGPPRLTASRRVPPRRVLAVALAFFALAAVVGLLLVFLSGQWWLLAVGALALLAAWFYTGGTHPYGYSGWGELVVFLFFGLVAVLGTVYLQAGKLSGVAVAVAVAQGLFASAVLLINNIRDVDQDSASGKRTLAVIIGRRPATALYIVLLAAPYVMLVGLAPVLGLAGLLAFASLPLFAVAVALALHPRTSRDYISALQLTSVGSLLFSGMLGFGLSIVPYL